jgi:glyceraldehyde 3-phosphate dehydrogenase
MGKIKVAINGFGRIGRMTARVLLSKPNMELIAINDLSDNKTLTHLFKYDSIHKAYQGHVETHDGDIKIDNRLVKIFAERDPSRLPWKDLEVDVVLECTGKFLDVKGATQHLNAGAGKVILSAPSKEKDGQIQTIVIGVNDAMIKRDLKIISNASCTTNNAAPMLKILDEAFGLESAYVTTVHSYTGDQNIHDAPHRDLRRARAAAVSIIPTTTGAAKALNDVLPHLKGKIGGAGIRVPVPNGSLTDITCILKKTATVDEVNEVFKKASKGNMKHILEYTEDPIVSIDIVDNPHSCIFDSQLTSVLGTMVKVVGWYDNEIGYSNRLAELAEKIVSI